MSLLQQKLETRADEGHMRETLCYMGIREDFRLVDELIQLTPILAAFEKYGILRIGIEYVYRALGSSR